MLNIKIKKLDPKKMARALNGKTVEWRKWDALDSVRYGVERYNNYKKGDRVMHERAEFVACGENQQNRIAAIREAFSTLYENVEKLCSERRETLIALDRLEEAQFWAIKGISRETHAE